jgi:hypothetical protein
MVWIGNYVASIPRLIGKKLYFVELIARNLADGLFIEESKQIIKKGQMSMISKAIERYPGEKQKLIDEIMYRRKMRNIHSPTIQDVKKARKSKNEAVSKRILSEEVQRGTNKAKSDFSRGESALAVILAVLSLTHVFIPIVQEEVLFEFITITVSILLIFSVFFRNIFMNKFSIDSLSVFNSSEELLAAYIYNRDVVSSPIFNSGLLRYANYHPDFVKRSVDMAEKEMQKTMDNPDESNVLRTDLKNIKTVTASYTYPLLADSVFEPTEIDLNKGENIETVRFPVGANYSKQSSDDDD